MALHLVQHGKNLSKDVDPEKGLSEEGRQEAARIADMAAKAGISVSAIFHSGKKRAAQTAEIFAAALSPSGGVEQVGGLAPLDDVAAFAETIDPDRDTMLVGHLPFMEKMTSYLVAGDAERKVFKFQNGGIVSLDKDEDSGRWMITGALLPSVR
ncbi:MAG: phosphohistidine phosphatase SixA [Desulfobacterales bacterium]|nr:phosphohistidine phosphatase SixA [Desulfobacterales bacterium]